MEYSCGYNILVIQSFHNEVLKCVVNAPWYVCVSDLHCTLKIEMVSAITNKLLILIVEDSRTTKT